MDTKTYRTRTIIQGKKNPQKNESFWPIAIDMGYSAVKGMSANSLFCFPSYARKVPKNVINLSKPEPTDILYRDAAGDIYAVGAKAEAGISIESTNDSVAALYGRNRYFSEIFRVCSHVGLALGLRTNEFGAPNGRKIKLQTGLPPKYMEGEDVNLLKEAFTGKFNFDIKVGGSDWEHFDFEILKEDIFVTQQPMGTMVSVAIDKNGNPTADADRLYHSNMLVFDPGFRTGDCCLIKKGSIDPDDCQTFDNLSMISVLSRFSEDIKNRYNVNIPVPAIQPYLEEGYIKVVDKKNLKSSKIDIADLLEIHSRDVCNAAIEKLCEVYNYFEEIDYLVLTGGTGAAWSNIIRDRLKDLETLTILSGNRNEELAHIFSNVRGYYMYLINTAR